jgi:aminopeptidase N
VKRIIASFLSLSLLIASCNPSTPTVTPNPTQISNPLQTPWADRTIFKSGLVESQQHVLNELKGASVYHLEFNIADDIYHVTGTEDVQYTNTETISLNEVEFRLFPNILGGEMQVSNLQVDGQSVTPQYGLAKSLLIVPLAKALQPQQSIVLHMDFKVTVPQAVDLNYGVLAYYDNVLALAHSYPMICVYNDEGWNAEIPSQDGDVTFNDASFYIVQIHAPKGLTLVTSGKSISSDEARQVQAVNVASGPARDFYLVASPNFEEVSQTFGEVTINSYANKAAIQGAKFASEVAFHAIDIYSKRYAPYPYTKLDIVATPTLALGIEYPGAIAIADRIYNIGSGSPTQQYMESTVAHEVGHQWFYNLVGNDQLDDPWLDESLAQFATLQYFTDRYGADVADNFHSALVGRWQRVNQEKILIGLPVAKYNGNEYGAIVYGRGPLFFEALRNKMGIAVFDEFMKDYTEALSWKISTPATLKALAEKHCACNLDAMFQEWVYP